MTQPARRAKVASNRPAGAAPRGRPTPERIAAIDAAIRQAALELFLDHGFEAASMDAIALRAGVAKGTLYARYETKEPLFRAILEDELKRWSQRAGEQDHLLPAELAPRLRHHARVLIDVFDWPEYRRISRLLEAAVATLPDLARHWEEIGTNRYLRFLAEDMARAAGGAAADWDFHAQVFVFAISGRVRAENRVSAEGRERTLAFADRLIDMIELAMEG